MRVIAVIRPCFKLPRPLSQHGHRRSGALQVRVHASESALRTSSAYWVEADGTFPEPARRVFTGLLDQFRATAGRIAALEAEIVAHARGDDKARRLATVPGIGPITASLIASMVGEGIEAFSSARHFAAWLGLVPRQHSTGGKTRLGRITKMGNREIRTLLVLGATSMVYRAAQWHSAAGAWTRGLLERP
jgi:transposase